MATEDLVFISYAREDLSWAERLYMDLRKQEINAWLDVKCLAAGANWQFETPEQGLETSKHLFIRTKLK